MSTTQDSATESASTVSARLRGWPLVATISALFTTLLMAAIDGSIVDTATPRIIADLHGFSLYSWLVTIYLLASTTTIPIAGKLSDLFGRKWFFIGGVLIFLLGSMLAGTSHSMIELIIFRGMQGMGSGILQTMTLVLVADIFPPKERARWLGLFSAVIIIASIIGPLAGGWITDHLGWRWIFYVNIPLGVCSLVLTSLWLPRTFLAEKATQSIREKLRRIDFIGALTIAGTIICLLLALTWGSELSSWNSPQILGLFVATVLLFLLFCYTESHVQDPILPFSIFKNQSFSAGALLSLLLGMVLFAIVVYLPLFMQAVQGQSPTSSGAVMTPLTFTVAILSILTGSIIAKIGRYKFIAIIGAVVLAAGVFLMTQMAPTTTSFEITRDVFLIGIGLGILMPLVNLATQNALPRQVLGVGTSAVTFLRSMGSTVATAVLGTIVNTGSSLEISNHLPNAARHLPAAFLKAATDKQVLTSTAYRQSIVQKGLAPTSLLDHLFEIVRQALASSIHQAFIITFYLSLLILVVAVFLRDIPASQGEDTIATPQVEVAKDNRYAKQ